MKIKATVIITKEEILELLSERLQIHNELPANQVATDITQISENEFQIIWGDKEFPLPVKYNEPNF